MQIPDAVHGAADARRRTENTTWDKVLVTLLTRWASGSDDGALAAPVRPVRTKVTGPDAVEHRAWHEQQMREDETYRKAATEKVNPSTLRFTSLGALVRANAVQAGRALPADALKELDQEDGSKVMSDPLGLDIDEVVEEANALFGRECPLVDDHGDILGVDLSDLAAKPDHIDEQMNYGSEGIPDGEGVPLCLTNENPVLGLCEVFAEDERLEEADVVGLKPVLGGALEHATHNDSEPTDIEAALAEIDGPAATMVPEFEPDMMGAWRRYQRMLPSQVRDLLLACVRRDYVRGVVLELLHDEHLLRDVHPDLRDAASVRDAWRASCSPSAWPVTRRMVREVRDEVVRELHKSSAFTHATYSKLPAFLSKWRPVNGVLSVVESGRTVPSIGWPALLEATPAQVIRYTYESWLTRKLAVDDPSELLTRKPHAWDLTGGAGTGGDILSILGCEVTATDLTSMNEEVGTLDARNFPSLLDAFPGVVGAPSPIARPDIVLFDPGSRGAPAHSGIYGADPEGPGDARDFAVLDRSAWIETISVIVRALTEVLARGGVVSLLVRAGVRDRGRVEADPRLVDDVKAALGDGFVIIEEVAIEWGVNRVRQACLSTARVPATHLLVGRAE